jgi:hypothetical protein
MRFGTVLSLLEYTGWRSPMPGRDFKAEITDEERRARFFPESLAETAALAILTANVDEFWVYATRMARQLFEWHSTLSVHEGSVGTGTSAVKCTKPQPPSHGWLGAAAMASSSGIYLPYVAPVVGNLPSHHSARSG